MKKLILLTAAALSIALPQTKAQQYVWAKNGGASSTLTSSSSMSVTTNATTVGGVAINETWVAPDIGSSTRYFGAGGAGDIGTKEFTNSILARYDANMNLVWEAHSALPLFNGNTRAQIAADPEANDQFYVAYQASSIPATGITLGGFTITGQVAAGTVVLAKCKATGTSGFSVIWIRKIDGNSDEFLRGLRVKQISPGNVRIAVSGQTRSTDVSSYNDGTTTIGHTTTVNGGGSINYDWFVAQYDGAGSSKWINDFGTATISDVNFGSAYMDMNDGGDVLFTNYYAAHSAGPLAYTLNNSSGASPGTITSTTYTATINNNRYILFQFNEANGTIDWVRNELASAGSNFLPRGITTDAAENVYVYGQLNASYTAAAGITITSPGGTDVGLIEFNNTGTVLRAQRYGNAASNAPNLSTAIPNGIALDRTNNRLYFGGFTSSGFTSGTATIQQTTGTDGFLLCVDASTGSTLDGIVALSNVGGAGTSQELVGAVALHSNGDVVILQDYAVSSSNRLNASTTDLFTRTAYGYADVAITKLDGTTGASLLNPLAQGGWGGLTGASIQCSAMKGSSLLSAGNFMGTINLPSVPVTLATTVGANNTVLFVTDTATGNITNAYQIKGNNVPTQIKVSPIDGSVYVVGWNTGDMGNPATGALLGKSGTLSNSCYIMKMDASFNHLWTAYIDGDEVDVATGLDIDPTTGDAYMSGYFRSPTLRLNPAGATTFSAGSIATNSNTSLPVSDDIFVAKFASDGTFQWISTGGSPSTTISDGITKGLAFMNGDIYVGGSRANAGTTFTLGGITSPVSSAGTNDMFLARLNPTTGAADWLKSWQGNGSAELINSLTTYDNRIFAGGVNNSTTGLSLGGVPFVSAGGNDAVVFAVDDAGTEQPGLVQLKGNNNDQINEIRSDGSGSIFFAGTTNSSSLPIAGSTLGTSGNNDWLVGAIDVASMTPKFGFVNGSTLGEQAYTITPGKLGIAFVGGNLIGTATFGSTVLPGRIAGDYAYARLDYPYLAPGAKVSNLNAWYKANNLLTGSPATAWTNSTANTSLTNITNTGTIAVNATGSNYNPTINVTGGANYLSQSGIYSLNFLDASANKFSVYTVYKPSTATDQLLVWNETTSGTGIILGAAGNTITGTGGAKTAANTTALSTSQFNLSSLLVNGSTMSNYLNGTANGSQTGVTPLSTTNPGVFKIDGSGTMEVAEVITYGGAHTGGQPSINAIETYLGVKYGITLGHHYYSTVGDTLYKITNGYANNIAGIAIDSNELLIQKQGRSQNTAAKGNMLTVGLGTIAADNAGNTTIPGAGISYLVWGDNAAGVTTTQNTDITTTASSCAYRMPREWKAQRTGTGTGPTQVTFDLNSTITLTGLTAADIQLMIDKDGDGNFTTGTSTLVNATTFTGNIVTFDNVNWDADVNGSDVFTLLFNNKIPNATLVANGISKAAPIFTCPDAGGALVFADNATAPTEKYLAVYPLGNTGYNFSATATNNNPAINNQMKTDGVANTTALMNRMYIINDAGTNNYPSGMKVRVYYAPADSTAAVAALDPAVAGIPSFRWFKMSGTTPSGVLTAQTTTGLSSATWLNPAAYGTENGINYVEFNGITSFSTFGAMASKGATPLPVHFISNHATAVKCSVILNWKYNTSGNTVLTGFEVERSNDGNSFTNIARLPAGNINYTDTPPASGTWQYRIKAVESNGDATYTPTMMVRTENCNNNTFRIYPNPANGMVYVDGISGKAAYQLIDALGRVLMNGTLSTDQNGIDVKHLPQGLYLVRLNVDGIASNQQIQIIR